MLIDSQATKCDTIKRIYQIMTLIIVFSLLIKFCVLNDLLDFDLATIRVSRDKLSKAIFNNNNYFISCK